MAYFIGNGAATIGGGSLGRTEQLPTLKLLCVDLCARHLDRLSSLGDMPTEVFIDLLKRAKGKATPALVQRLQDSNKRLVGEEVDTTFWKQAVDDHILRRTVPAPGPVLVERVNGHKERLSSLLREAADQSAPSKDWSADVIVILKALDEVPSSVGLLRETLIGMVVSPLRSNANSQISRPAKDLVRRWKEAARARGPDSSSASASASPPPPPPSSSWKAGNHSRSSSSSSSSSSTDVASSSSSRGSSSGGRGKGRVYSTNNSMGGSGEGDRPGVDGVVDVGDRNRRNPAEEKQRSIEDGFTCRTWHSLYQHLELLRKDKVRASSKRAREAKEREQQKRPKMIMGKSKGEDFTKGRQRLLLKEQEKEAAMASPGLGSRGFSSPPPPSTRRLIKKKPVFGGIDKKKLGDEVVTSVAELRRNVVIDQRLSTLVQDGRKRPGGGALRPSQKKSKFWK